MREILSMIKIDWRLISRNPIVLFVAAAPVILSIAFLAVLGGATQGTIGFAVTENVPAETIANLQKVGNVEIVRDEGALKQRVEKFDHVAGVTYSDSSYRVFLEGNEGDSFARQVQILVQRAANNDIPAFSPQKVDSRGNVIVELSAVSLLLSALFLSSVVSGFNIVSEREGKTIRALAASPIGFARYLGARTLTAMVLGFVNMVLCTLIMGKGQYMGIFLLSALCTAATSALIALGLGCTAGNQIAAIASIKIIMPACLALPIASFFVPKPIKVLFWWLPNFWQFESLISAWNGNINWIANFGMLLTGFIWLVILKRFFKKKLGLI